MSKSQILKLKVVELKAKLAEVGLLATSRTTTFQYRLFEHCGLAGDGYDDDNGDEVPNTVMQVHHHQVKFKLKRIIHCTWHEIRVIRLHPVFILAVSF